jgi:hypothetical protein
MSSCVSSCPPLYVDDFSTTSVQLLSISQTFHAISFFSSSSPALVLGTILVFWATRHPHVLPFMSFEFFGVLKLCNGVFVWLVCSTLL